MDVSKPNPFLNFATTRWTLVLKAQGASPAAHCALGELCQAYWQPVYKFLLREGRSHDTAAELTQEFFAKLLEGDSLSGAQQKRGRFRSYLLGALKHFLVNQRLRERRLKRGGEQTIESIDQLDDDGDPELQVEDPHGKASDAYFDREWALAVMDGALKSLQREFVSADKAKEFDVLKPWLAGKSDAISYAKAGDALGLSEVALKVSVHRLRKRIRELIRKELSETVPTESEIEEELRYLIEVLSHP